MAYVEGFLIPVAPGKRDAYRKVAEQVAPLFKELGALEIVECFEDDIRDGKVTDFRRAVAAEPGEKIVFSWVVWPSREVRDAANAKMMEDDRMQPTEMPFSRQRMIMGGFTPILQTGSATVTVETARENEPA